MKAIFHREKLELTVKTPSPLDDADLAEYESVRRIDGAKGHWIVTARIALCRTGLRTSVLSGSPIELRGDPILISALRRAHKMIRKDPFGPTVEAAPTSQYGRRLMSLAMLAPRIQRAILNGEQPPQLTLATLLSVELPLAWTEQSRMLGFD